VSDPTTVFVLRQMLEAGLRALEQLEAGDGPVAPSLRAPPPQRRTRRAPTRPAVPATGTDAAAARKALLEANRMGVVTRGDK
jgi:hypothetical protein